LANAITYLAKHAVVTTDSIIVPERNHHNRKYTNKRPKRPLLPNSNLELVRQKTSAQLTLLEGLP
jgi:hypothetical protein